MIRGDLPAAAGLADVWLDLHTTLEIIAAPTAGRTVRRARKVRPGELGTAEPTAEGNPDEPDEPGRAAPSHIMKYPGMPGRRRAPAFPDAADAIALPHALQRNRTPTTRSQNSFWMMRLSR